jgi:predicted anti-sigma-YlaC factor YlaD
MNCLECHDWLQRRLDGEPPPAIADLDQHLADCPSCRRQHQAAGVLRDGLSQLSPAVPNLDLGKRIVASVLAARQARLRIWRRFGTTAALAACLMLMALAGYFWLPYGKNKSSELAKDQPQQPDAYSFGQSVDEARQALAALTERIADKSKEQAQALLLAAQPLEVPPMALPGARELEQPFTPAAESLRRTGLGVSEGLQTVAHSARRAVNYFYKELPPLEPGSKY